MSVCKTGSSRELMSQSGVLKVALPKGRLWDSTMELLEKSGIKLGWEFRNYQPSSNLGNVKFYIVKPRNIPKMVEKGMVDIGIVGHDLVVDEKADVNDLLDLKTMPIYLVLAAKNNCDLLENGKLTDNLMVATEYSNISHKYLDKIFRLFRIIKTYGSTECFVPDFADIIIDHTQTGETLKKNGLKVLDVIMTSTTRLIGNKSLSSGVDEEGNGKKEVADQFVGMLAKGLEKIDLNYPNFLTEEQVRNNQF